MAALKPIGLTGVGLVAPGLPGWTASLPVLRGLVPHRPQELPQLKPSLLPAGERRRATSLVRLTLAAAEDAMAGGRAEQAPMGSVFASSSGDLAIVDRICDALTLADRPVSPTHFHNSVHNAASGYWSIATGWMTPSVSLSAYDDTFVTGLTEAMTMVHSENAPILLVTYDQPGPAPFYGHRAITEPFAVALLLDPDLTKPHLAEFVLGVGKSLEPAVRLADPCLDALLRANPAARSLPLLIAVAGGESRTIRLSQSVDLVVHSLVTEDEVL
ncbi:MAG: beta-ketoacyl synthase chain length factor [Rhodospirillales bacterium]